ncbi:MAG TPA: DUF3883 domain-containing protein [Archangium sp.]|uniref:protein NO VEIN domain-containing protein n=1 Tax=Archangium sp. TaxID=1872627 RepID=UPI002E325426|nr:DUF3883 domain-containing protein [Archangium sp.]HEX5750550.1 DUF3883 domain-containing protein [Archangium sp.]
MQEFRKGRRPRVLAAFFRCKQGRPRWEFFLYTYLQNQAKKKRWTSVTWVAAKGQTPGWDIQYKDTNGVLQVLEVKTTTGQKFSSVEITAGEWAAASKKRGDYHLVLVADIYGAAKLQFIRDPVGWVQEKTARTTPLVYRFSLYPK